MHESGLCGFHGWRDGPLSAELSLDLQQANFALKLPLSTFVLLFIWKVL
jgi:hypothetical protein